MTVYDVQKVADQIRFIREDDKYWYFDLTDLSMHGFSGKVVKNYPADGLRTMKYYASKSDSTVSILLSMINDGFTPATIGVVERLIAATGIMGYSPSSWNTYREERIAGEYSETKLRKTLIKLKKRFDSENYAYYYRFHWDLETLARSIDEDELYGENGKYTKYVAKYGEDTVRKYVSLFGSYRVCETCPNWLDRALKYSQDEEINYLINLGLIREDKLKDMIRNIFNWCSEMKVKLPKGKLIKEYALLKDNYEVWKETAQDNSFAEVQSLITPFESGDYVALVPTTVKELVEEGNAQRNCAGGVWLRGYGNTLGHFARGMFFVRKKNNPEKSYITCDFDRETGKIKQYYLAANTATYDEADLAFKRELQQHIYECLGIN